MASTKRYFGISWIVCVILAIIPLTNIVLGFITRIQRKNILGAVLNLLLCPILWLVDLITMIVSKDIKFLA
jgi:hypothetical protein